MQFMADVNLTCEICNGKRFKNEVLRVKFEEKNIDDILKMTVDQSIDFFSKHNQNRIVKKIKSYVIRYRQSVVEKTLP